MMEPEAKEKAGSCPSEERFLDFFLGNNPGSEDETILDHIDRCPDCRIKFGLLRDLEPVLERQIRRLQPLARASRRELRAGFRADGRSRRGARILAAAGITAMVALSFAAWIIFQPRGHDTVERGNAAVASSLPNGRLAEAPRLFVWEPVPGAESYRFALIDESLSLVAEANSAENWILLSASIRKDIRPGRTYIWTVDAYDDGGVKIGSIPRYFYTK